MPTAPLPKCKRHECKERVKQKGYKLCVLHSREYWSLELRTRDKEGYGFYKTKEWRMTRTRYATLHPVCELCSANDRTSPTHTVDHIKQIKNGGSKFDFNNLQSLCISCNAQKRGKESASLRAKGGG